MDDKNKLMFDIIHSTIDNYKDDLDMLEKLYYYIEKIPKYLNNIKVTKLKRQQREKNRQCVQDEYYSNFLKYNNFSYLKPDFISYENNEFKIIKEDDLWKFIMDDIRGNSLLQNYSHQTRTNLLKFIKDTSFYDVIPESSTIQKVIYTFIPLFGSKSLVKYFLFVIGNIIDRKKKDIYFITEQSSVELINIISEYCIQKTKVNIFDNLKTKYSINYKDNLRIININHQNAFTDLLENFLRKNGLDFINVCCHHSKRYTETEILNKNKNVRDHILYFVKNTPETTITSFINSEYISKSNNESECLTYDEMKYVYRIYLCENKIPLDISDKQLKSILSSNLKVKQSSQKTIYTNVSSNYINNFRLFDSFKEGALSDDSFEKFFEIEEIAKIYNDTHKNDLLSESEVLSIFKYFYSYEIEDAKYINKIKCNLWDKQYDLHLFFENHSEKSYLAYVKYAKDNFSYVMSKTYFDFYSESF
tara:strand:- start:59 stop:1483 length:1425 start_codon:yes stop_codon:yes gene_type:complete